jgi:hypothetical protein
MPKITKSKIPLEHVEQVDIVNNIRNTYPNYLLFAVPNGEKRSISVAKRLKDEGVLPGMTDLVLLTPVNEHGAIFIEMKRQKGSTTSEEQKKIHKELREMGYTVILAKGAKDAWEQLTKVLRE